MVRDSPLTRFVVAELLYPAFAHELLFEHTILPGEFIKVGWALRGCNITNQKRFEQLKYTNQLREMNPLTLLDVCGKLN